MALKCCITSILALIRARFLLCAVENGAGKSTLMKILACIYQQDKGDVLIDGHLLPKNSTALEAQKLGIAMIHQELNLLEEMTIAQNIFLSREPRNKFGLIDYKNHEQGC